MAEKLPVNSEKLAIDFLLANDPVNDLIDGRIGATLPNDPEWPFLQVVAFDDDPITQRPLHLVQGLLQVSAYGATKSEAFELGATARAELHAADRADHDAGIVTGVSSRGWGFRPDDSFSPAQPRYTFDLTLFLHPHP